MRVGAGAKQLAQTVGVGLALVGAAVLAVMILTAALRIGERSIQAPPANERPLVIRVPADIKSPPSRAHRVQLSPPSVALSSQPTSAAAPALVELEAAFEVR